MSKTKKAIYKKGLNGKTELIPVTVLGPTMGLHPNADLVDVVVEKTGEKLVVEKWKLSYVE